MDPSPRRAIELTAALRSSILSEPLAISRSLAPARSLRRRENPLIAALRATGTVVEVDHPERGKYLTVGNPIKMSDSPSDVKRSPLLGEHTDEVLTELGYGTDQIAALRADKVI